ncbi:MAG: asparagine synthase (glutamine-hydrolyzing) [Phycisphaerales bacterium]|nr:asparagine synthase (glutamine-hydrolyzing) [Phycisphaerales bacterium]
MCGIFAVLGSRRHPLPPDAHVRVSRALDAIAHRGPDACGVHISPDGSFALGHVRLSVIDPSAAANQPFWSECGRHCLVFNGEIYNYVELADELRALGVSFRTSSDTEVLLQALMRWGTDALPRLNGMWSLVYGDVSRGEFIVSRDRWGVKPLHVARHEGRLVLCSEAKGIVAFMGHAPAPDLESIGLFLRLGVGGERPQSWYRGIERFPIACGAAVRVGNAEPADLAPVPYWRFPAERVRMEDADAVRQFGELLEDAVRIRLRSDVPVGLSLSGGLDSTSIAWITSQRWGHHLEAFTAWYEPREQSELPAAERIASMYGHRSTAIPQSDPSQTVDVLEDCVHYLDCGHLSTAIVPYMQLCRAARRHVTVMLEGQGADELLAGYPPFSMYAAADRLRAGQLGQSSRAALKYVRTLGPIRALLELIRHMSRTARLEQGRRWGANRLLGAGALVGTSAEMPSVTLSGGNLARELELSHRTCLTNLLQYGDAMSMSVNLETRCPFLDYRLVDLCFRMSTDLIYRDGRTKWVLRKAASGNLPDDICWSSRKEGFTNPSAQVLREYVMQRGLPRDALEAAIRAELFTPALRAEGAALALPDTILFRVFSALAWFQRAQLPGAPRLVAP